MPDETTLTMYVNNASEENVKLIIEPEGHRRINEPLNVLSYRAITVPEAPSYKIRMLNQTTTTTDPTVIATFTGTSNEIILTSRQS